MKVNKINKFLPVFLLVLLLLPTLGLALSSGISPLDGAINTISRLFNIKALDTPIVKEGFLKFMIFIVLFSVTFRALRMPTSGPFSGEQGSRTAGIVSFAFSMIGVFMMPNKWLLATGGTITALMSSLIFMFVFWGGTYLALKVLSSEDGKQYGWVMHLLGLLVVLLLMNLLPLWNSAVGLSAPSNGDIVRSTYYYLVDWTGLLLTIALIVKVIQFFSMFGWVKNAASAVGTAVGNAAASATGIGSSSVSKVNGFDGKNTGPEVRLWWAANPPGDNVREYVVQKRNGRTGFRRVLGGWDNLATETQNRDQTNPLIDHSPSAPFTYRIRAIADAGKSGWHERTFVVGPAAVPDFSTQLNDLENAVNRASGLITAYQVIAIDVLRINHNYFRGRGPMVPRGRISDLNQALQNILDQVDIARQNIQAIVHSPEFINISGTQRVRLLSLLRNYHTFIRALITLITRIRMRFNSGSTF